MSKIKTLIISPPWGDFRYPPISICALASFARSNGFDVDIRHVNLELATSMGIEKYYSVMDYSDYKNSSGEAICAAALFPSKKKRLLDYAGKRVDDIGRIAQSVHHKLSKIYETIDWQKYSVVGFTTNHEQLFSSLLIAAWIKRDHPKIRTVLGGAAVFGELGRSVLQCFPQVDWCIDREGELAFVSLLESLQENRGDIEKIVPGLIYRDGNAVRINPRQQLVSLVNLPDPDYDDYFMLMGYDRRLQGLELSPYLPIELSRGCNYGGCAFCSEQQFFEGYRTRPAEDVADSLRRLSIRYKIPSVFLLALMITPDYARVLFPLLMSHNIDYSIACQVRAGMPKDVLSLMKDAGVTEIQVGIEALNARLLNRINKGTRLIDNIESMKHCEELGLRQDGNLITGFPGETRTEIDFTTEVMGIVSAFMPLSIAPFELVEGTHILNNPKKYGIDRIKDVWGFEDGLPKEVSGNLRSHYKEYKRLTKSPTYKGFYKQYEGWKKAYENSLADGHPLLCYLDLNTYLEITDLRNGTSLIVLDGAMRELYLFCDSIRHFLEIRSKFGDLDDKDLRSSLDALCDLRVMFAEDDNYLSLAIRSDPCSRHNEQFRY